MAELFSNGDCLYATAIARQIKHDFPGCQLTWAVAPSCRSVLLNNPYVDVILEVPGINKGDVVPYRHFKQKMRAEKRAGIWREVFFITNLDENYAWYDGCVRTNVLRPYPKPITVGVTPVMRFSEEEQRKVQTWVREKGLSDFRHVVLFEFAPQSGQLDINREKAIKIAEELVRRGDTSVIMSSAQKVDHPAPAIIDGSELSFRESILLSNWCTMLLGTSSGITWGTTSDGGKLLPMVQLLNPWAPWVNPVSRDFERQGLPVEQVIELIRFDEAHIIRCVSDVLDQGIRAARGRYNQEVPLHFKTTRLIVYNLLVYARIGAIVRHLRLNIGVYGFHPALFGQAALGMLELPVKLLRNRLRKRRHGTASAA